MSEADGKKNVEKSLGPIPGPYQGDGIARDLPDTPATDPALVRKALEDAGDAGFGFDPPPLRRRWRGW